MLLKMIAIATSEVTFGMKKAIRKSILPRIDWFSRNANPSASTSCGIVEMIQIIREFTIALRKISSVAR